MTAAKPTAVLESSSVTILYKDVEASGLRFAYIKLVADGEQRSSPLAPTALANPFFQSSVAARSSLRSYRLTCSAPRRVAGNDDGADLHPASR